MLQNGGCQIAILVGGKGTRLRTRTGDMPKPMALLHGRPVLEHQIDLCRRNGFTRIALLAGYKHQAISEYFGDGEKFGVELTYSVEETPRGTSGALADALPIMADKFFVLYGDTYADIDLRAMLAEHEVRSSDATLFLHPNDHPADSDLVSVDADGWVTAIHPYPHREGLRLRNLVNAALYIFEMNGISEILKSVGPSDIAKHAIPEMLRARKRVFGYVTPEYIKDIGTPERLDKVSHQILSGLPERLSARRTRSAVFLDRDGTLNHHAGHLSNVQQMAIIEGSGGAVRALNQNGMLAIVITNQPVLARGEVDFQGFDEINSALDQMLGEEGAYLDAFYYCPHHPDKGFPGEVEELKQNCACRKPLTGLVDRAVRRFNIDPRKSWFIGDTTSDVLTGIRAGLRTILVLTGEGGKDRKYNVQPDFIFASISEAVDWILGGLDVLQATIFPLIYKYSKSRSFIIAGKNNINVFNFLNVFEYILRISGRNMHKVNLGSAQINCSEYNFKFDPLFHIERIMRIAQPDEGFSEYSENNEEEFVEFGVLSEDGHDNFIDSVNVSQVYSVNFLNEYGIKLFFMR